MFACLVAHGGFAPRGDRAGTAHRALALAAAVGVVAGVHDGTADGGPPAHVALAAGFADVHILVIDIAHLTDGGDAVYRHIALVQYEDGEKRYIIAPEGLKVGDTVMSGANADIKPGNCLPFVNIPVGTIVHNIELYPGKGAQLVRSAGNMAQLMAKEGKYALVRLPSGARM